MRDRKTLTKSLHTVTVVSRVAQMIVPNGTVSAEKAARLALAAIGQPDDWAANDETFAACVAKIKALREAK
jgi:hypothetical protein